jgi:copper chaperone
MVFPTGQYIPFSHITIQPFHVSLLKFSKMEKTLKFKTNINCGGCVAKVTPFLNEEEGICHWDVDTASAEKTLTVKVDGILPEEVSAIVKEAGFRAEEIPAK